MKEKPILFSEPMIRAILAGNKTQTRRIAKSKKQEDFLTNNKLPYKPNDVLWVRETFAYMDEFVKGYKVDPYYHIGYRADLTCRNLCDGGSYLSTEGWNWQHDSIKWKPGIYMPKDACRIFLKVKNVRLERLKDISEEDCKAEGIKEPKWHYKDLCKIPVDQIASDKLLYFDYRYKKDYVLDNAIQSYRSLWEFINGGDSWDDNPFVFVTEFERIGE